MTNDQRPTPCDCQDGMEVPVFLCEDEACGHAFSKDTASWSTRCICEAIASRLGHVGTPSIHDYPRPHSRSGS